MRTSRQFFDSQMKRAMDAVAHFAHAVTEADRAGPGTSAAVKMWLALDDTAPNFHLHHVLVLCNRVLDKIPDFRQGRSEEDAFAEAFMLIYNNARERLIKSEYDQRYTCAAKRFLGECMREGDAYFVDRFEVVAVGIARDD